MTAALKIHEDNLFFQHPYSDFHISFESTYIQLDPGQDGKGPDGGWTNNLPLMFRGLKNVRYPFSFEEVLKYHPGDIGPDSEMGGVAGYSCGSALVSSQKDFTDQYLKYRFKQCQERNAFQAGRFLYGLLKADDYVRSRILKKDATNLLYVSGDRVIEITWIPHRKQWYIQHHQCDTCLWSGGTRVICSL